MHWNSDRYQVLGNAECKGPLFSIREECEDSVGWQLCRSLARSGYKSGREAFAERDFWWGKYFASISSVYKMTHKKSLFLTLMGAAALTQAANVHYSLDLTWQRGSPNGHEREMIFVNDRFPGPPLILDEGDEVTVSLILLLFPSPY